MPTIDDNKTYLTDASRYPKLTSTPVTLPRYQHTADEYNRIIEMLVQLTQRQNEALYDIDSLLDPESQNPVQNRAVTEAIGSLKADMLRCQVAVFRTIEPAGTLIQQSSSVSSTPDQVCYFADAATFGLVPSAGLSTSQPSLATPPQYYANWPNRPIYADDQLHPYADKLYFCIAERRLYAWDGAALLPVGGEEVTVDAALSDTSQNPVQNAVITSALNSIQQSVADTVAEYFLRTVQSEIGEYVSVTMGGDGWLTITALQDIGYDSPAYGIGVALPIGKEIASGSKLQVEGWKDETNTDYTDYIGCAIDFCPYYPDATAEESFTPTLGEAGEPETSEHLFFNDVAASYAVVKWGKMYEGDTICIRLRYTDASSMAARAYNAVQRYYIMSMAGVPANVIISQDFLTHILSLTPHGTPGMIAIWLGGLVPPSGSVRVRGWLKHGNGTYSIGIYHSDSPSAYSESNSVDFFAQDTYNEQVEIDWTIEASAFYRPDYLIIPVKTTAPVEMLEGRLQLHLFIEGNFLSQHLDALYKLVRQGSGA